MKRTLSNGAEGGSSGSTDGLCQHDISNNPPCKRPRTTTTASGIDLVYPYWYQINTSEVTPPLIDPNGPIYDNNGLLSLRITQPLSIVNHSLALLTDATLGVSEDGRLGVVIDPDGALTTTEDGLDIRVNNSLEVDLDWELGVRFAPEQPFEIRPCGIVLNIDDTLLMEQNDDTEDFELGVHLSHEGPLTSDENGLDIDIDDSLTLVDLNAAKALSVRVPPEGPLAISERGLALNTDETLDVQDGLLGMRLNTTGPLGPSEGGLTVFTDKTLTVTTANGQPALGVKLHSGGPVVADGDGLFLLYNSDDFRNDAGRGLSLAKSLSYLSPYSYLTSGSPTLNSFSAVVRSDTSRVWPCSYYLYMANSSGIVNGMLRIRLDRERISDVGSGTRTSMSFTFIIDTNEGQSTTHSQMGDIDTVPPNTASAYVPNPEAEQTDYAIPAPTENWFTRHRGQIREFAPLGINFEFILSRYSYWVARNTANNQKVVGISVNTNTATGKNDWYTTNKGSMITGDIPFSFQGSIVRV